MKLTLNLAEGKVCAKCGMAEPPIFRHHKGNDAYLAHFDKRISFNYDRYLDCAYLCFDHHCEIHWLYEQRLIRFWVDWTPNGAQRMRKKCLDLCNKWLKGRIKSSRIPKEFREQFIRSFEEFSRVRTP